MHNHSKLLCSTIWYHCSNNFPRRLKVQITANSKGWYTLLLEFPSFSILKPKLVIFYGRIVLLHNYSTSLCSTIWHHCNSLLSGLKVWITANIKGWYTWLLEFPTLINLKNKCCFHERIVSLCNYIYLPIASSNIPTQTIFKKGNVSKIGSSSSHFQKGTTAYA